MNYIALFASILLPSAIVSAAIIPKIVETSPKFWETGVRPTLKEISVSFDQPLRYGFSSWLGVSSVAPTSLSVSSTSEDGLTSTLPVGLLPGRVYVFALNEKQIPGVGFQTKKGVPLPPHFLVFQTTGTPAPDEASPRALTINPQNGTQNVDAARSKAVTVIFDKPMQNAKHGMHMRENQKDVDLSKARFQYSPDGKTFTLAYDFKPASTYEFELNSVHDIGFASAKRVPLWPGKFAFSTQ